MRVRRRALSLSRSALCLALALALSGCGGPTDTGGGEDAAVDGGAAVEDVVDVASEEVGVDAPVEDVEPPECTEVADCDDGIDCTDDQCVYGGTCTHLAVDSDCDDGDPCTSGRCDLEAGCAFEPIDAACEDDDPCTLTSCVAGACVVVLDSLCECASDADCADLDDDDACNGVVVCDATADDPLEWSCVLDASAVPVCDTSEDGECAITECVAASGECELVPRADASPCDDGDVCTNHGACTDGACESGAALDCDDGNPCTTDGCEVDAGGCANTPSGACDCDLAADCVAFDDGDLCNGTLTCVAGACMPDPESVPAPCPGLTNECAVNACEPSTGECVEQSVNDGTPCDDGDACTSAGTCAAGSCQAGPALDCDDHNTCTLDSCDGGCVNAPLVGQLCDDADACTSGDTCAGDGTCVSGAAVVCDDGEVCTEDSCHEVPGCVTAPADGVACDDDDPCTTGDACLGGSCALAAPTDCDDGDVCTVDACGVTGCTHAADAGPLTVVITGLPEGGATNAPVTPDIAVSETNIAEVSATVDGAPFPLGGTIDTPGEHTVEVTAVNCAGVAFSASASFVLDGTPPQVTATLDPQPNALGWNREPVTVTFAATDEVSEIVSVSEPVTISNATTGQLIVGQATDAAGNTASVSVTVMLDTTPPVVAVTQPLLNQPEAGQLVVGGDTITLTGVIGDDPLSGFAVAGVESTKGTASLDIDAPGIFVLEVPLHIGVNMLLVKARDNADNVGATTLTVVRDADPPMVNVQYPPDGFHTLEPLVTVTGLANDLVAGTVTDESISVTVNGIDAEVANRQFVVLDVPLVLGPNTLTAVAVDAAGHTVEHSVTVTLEDPDGDRIERVSGDAQSGQVLTTLPQPLSVRFLDAGGQPVAGQQIVFSVADNGGWLANPGALATAPDGRSVVVQTGPDGSADAWLTLGARAGAGLNRVTVTAAGAAAPLAFCATGLPGAPVNIYANMGNGQVGTVHEPMAMPLAVLVTDVGHNAVADVPVTFHVFDGDGAVAGGKTTAAGSNSSGIAGVLFVPGADTGPSVHRVRASIPGIKSVDSETADGVLFSLSAYESGDPADTAVAGTVVDQDEQPIAGATVRFPGGEQDVVTDEAGTFTYLGAPVGFTVMEIDGKTAVPEGVEWTYPTMHFEMHTIPGITNHLDRPAYLLQLQGGVWVDGLTTQTVTTDLLPDFEMTVPAGTLVTFPDGANAGIVSIVQVHFDQAPMAPMNGLSSRALVTIQPPGVTFDPPAPLQIPNVDGYLPTEKVEMFSYDHDLEAFVAIGTGTVSDDGTVIQSDPGVGVVKGGWHCGSNPQGSGASAGVTATLSSSGAGSGKTATLNASGSPGDDSHWEWQVTCGDIQVEGDACQDQSSCTATATSSAESARGKVQVTHICDETGASASDEMVVTICDAPSSSDKIEVKLFGNEFEEIVGAATTALEYVGCDIGKPKIEVKAEATQTEQCCPGCPGVVGTTWDVGISGGAELGGECMTPLGFKFPSSVFDFKFGLFGAAKIEGKIKLGADITDCCADPPCFCFKGAISAGLTVGLKLYVIKAEILDFSIIDVHGAANTGVSGGFDVSCKKACGSLCWDGLNVSGKIDFLNGAIAYTKEVSLICPKKLLGKCYNFDLPAGSPSSGGCGASSDTCGEPGDPGQGPGQDGGGADASCGGGDDCSDNSPKCLSSAECDDGDPCNGTELCDPSFGCVPGDEEPDCDDGIGCTIDDCEQGVGCVHDPDDSLCASDGVGCTDDVCRSNSGCEYEPDDAKCDDGVGCTDDRCDETWDCEHDPRDEQCDDGVGCTEDTCDAQSDCNNEPQDAECDDGVDCTDDACDTAAGCQSDANDAHCDDGVGCTDDACEGGAGCANAPNDGKCDDGVGCTDDSCDPGADCQNAPNDGRCDDGVSCTNDSCDAGADCQNAPDDAACDDGNACSGVESCSAGAGCLAGVALQCNDGNVCNGIESCDPGSGCSAGTPLSCGDGKDCTVDGCFAASGCYHEQIPGCGFGGGGGGGACPCDPAFCSGPSELTTYECAGDTCEESVEACPGGQFCVEGDDESLCAEVP